jgi:hypothetical protein
LSGSPFGTAFSFTSALPASVPTDQPFNKPFPTSSTAGFSSGSATGKVPSAFAVPFATEAANPNTAVRTKASKTTDVEPRAGTHGPTGHQATQTPASRDGAKALESLEFKNRILQEEKKALQSENLKLTQEVQALRPKAKRARKLEKQLEGVKALLLKAQEPNSKILRPVFGKNSPFGSYVGKGEMPSGGVFSGLEQ